MPMRPLALLATLAVSLAPATPRAQDTGEPVVIGHALELQSRVLDEARRILVHTPEGYGGGDERYPVLYLLDGAGHFHHTTGITAFLAANDRIPPMIVVGVCNTDRTRDLTPSKPADDDPEWATAGGADAFLRFLTDELAPWIDARYRTRPLRVLVGHSFGGLFAIHALRTRPDFFRGLIAISPSMQWDDQRLVRELEAWLRGRPEVRASIHITAGNEGVGLLGGSHKVAGLLSEHAPPTLRWNFVHMPTESHGSVPHLSTYHGLEFVFAGWYVPDPVALYDSGGLDAVRGHHARVRARLGYEPEMPRGAWQPLLVGMIRRGRLTDARDVAEAGGEVVPPQFWHFLASQHEERGEAAAALDAYRRCLGVHPYDATSRAALIAKDVEPPPMPAPAEVPEELLRAYTGRYRITTYAVDMDVVAKDGTLEVTATGRKRMVLHAKSTTEFITPDGAVLRFRRDAAGRGQLVMDVGREIACERLPDDAK